MVRILCILALCVAGSSAFAQAADRICTSDPLTQKLCIRKAHYVYDTCAILATVSARYDLNPHFFARLIWQESRFDPNALSHAGAQGIAQFMPATAALRGLKDSYNPADALDHSARYLAQMKAEYGSYGLAAIGYNGGEARARRLLAGGSGLPRETRDYVRIITGVPYEGWLKDPLPKPDFTLDPELSFAQACHKLGRNRRISQIKTYRTGDAPWGIHITFGVTRAEALKRFNAQTRACRREIGGEQPLLTLHKSRSSRTGEFYVAQLGRADRASAFRDCRALLRRGCRCTVRNNDP